MVMRSKDTITKEPKVSTSEFPFVEPHWFSKNKAKRLTEKFFLWYSCVWICYFGRIVVTEAYEEYDEWDYLFVGCVVAFPCFLVPLCFPSLFGEEELLFSQRFVIKANAWIAVFGFIGNYFWTHYFYNLLGASYTLPSHRINNVPICMFLFTHAYFCTYHTFTTIVLRRFWTSKVYQCVLNTTLQRVFSAVFVFLLSFTTAFIETWTISSFPYWTFTNVSQMYTVGSVCYSLYFIVSFPMYYRLDESTTRLSLKETVADSLAAGMIVTVLLDLWRISIGGIVDGVPNCVPFM